MQPRPGNNILTGMFNFTVLFNSDKQKGFLHSFEANTIFQDTCMHVHCYNFRLLEGQITERSTGISFDPIILPVLNK